MSEPMPSASLFRHSSASSVRSFFPPSRPPSRPLTSRKLARLAPVRERGGPPKRLLFALRRELAAGRYGVIATGAVSVPPALEFTVMDGGKGDVSVTGPSV